MKKVNYKNEEISLLGFGAMRFPTKDGEIDKELSFEMMDLAYESGVNYFDTAWPYHNQQSEILMGEYLKTKKRSSYYLATKLPIWLCKDKGHVEEYFYKQLENLQVEHVDFYLIHAMNQERFDIVKSLDVLKTLEKLKKEGKIKNIGFSFHDKKEVFFDIVDYYNWDFAQIQINYMDVDHQQGIDGLNLLVEKNIPAIVMEPVKGGRLAGYNEEIDGMFKQMDPKASVASWAFRWVGSLPGVMTILSGMSTFEQVEDNINTFTDFQPLTEKEVSELNTISEKIRSRVANICTRCRYCMPCPYNVDIPGVLHYQNDITMYSKESGTFLYNMLNKHDAYADKCVSCGECLPKCPQQIDIPGLMEQIASE